MVIHKYECDVIELKASLVILWSEVTAKFYYSNEY